jgi:hypothetical protein
VSAEPQFRTKPFCYDIDDLQALAREVHARWFRRLRNAGFVVVGLLALTIMIDMSIMPSDLDWAAMVAGAIATVLLFLLSSTRFRAWVWLQLMRRSPFHAEHSFGLLPDALLVESPKARSEVLWNAIQDVRRAQDRMFFFMSKRLAYMVPRRAFGSDAEFEEFAAAADQRWRQSR